MSRSTSDRQTSARKTPYHHGDLRRTLLDVTLHLVDENGPQGFTLRAAARAAGVTPGSAYHHFEDKDALLAAVAEEGFDLFRRALEEAAHCPAASASERSQNVGVAYVLFAVKQPTRFRIMAGFGVQRTKGRLAASAIATYRFVRDVLIAGLQSSSDEEISEAEVLGWWSVVHGLAFLAIDGNLCSAGSSLKRVDAVVRDVIKAMDRRQQRVVKR